MGSSLDEIIRRVGGLPDEEAREVLAAAHQATRGMLWVPNDGPQTDAYLTLADILLFGGEAGGGKSDLMIGLALNEHTVSQIFREQHNDRVAIVRRLAEIWLEVAAGEGPKKPPGYDGQNHIWQAPEPCGVVEGRRPVIEFGALSTPDAWTHYMGRPADLKGYDELVRFSREGFTSVNGWNRSVNPKQRCRVIGATNPPVTPEGLWVVDYFAPWLDPKHPNPAKPGELRWFASIGDNDSVPVEKDWRGVDSKGREVLPRSRTFIPSSLEDNPDLNDTGYAAVLAGLPEAMREALAEGKWRSTFNDDHWQVIPTEWVIAAQQRWEVQKAKFDSGELPKGPMSAMGVDPAGGGKARMVLAPRYGVFFDTLEEVKPGKDGISADADLKDPRIQASGIFFHVRDDAQVNIDDTGGWGAGAASILESNRHPVVRVVFSATSDEVSRDGKRFSNKRAAMYWLLREALDPVNGDDLALPPGMRLLRHLTAVRWKPVRIKGLDAIELYPKEEAEARVGESLDEGDAVALSWSERDAIGRGEHSFHKARFAEGSNRANARAKERSRAWRRKDR